MTTDHLPECETYRKEIGYVCICGLLRACEQRVLDAAREAVERVSSLLQPLGPALAAIDTLRRESDV